MPEYHSPPGERVSFSCVAKRKSPKRRPPQSGGLRASCPPTPRQGSGGSLTAPPCAGSKLGAIPCAHPAGLSCALPPPLTGPLKRASCAPKRRAKPKPIPKRAGVCFVLAAQARAWMPEVEQRRSSCRMRSEWAPYAAAQRRRKGPKGGSQGCEPVGCQSRDGLSDNPGAAARSRRAGCPETAVSGWPFSWLLLFGHAKRSDSLAGRRVINRHGCRAAMRRALDRQDH
jgi:hypothetical protein